MSSERLREAAQKIRGHANLASPGPWHEEPETGGTFRVRASYANGGPAWFAAAEDCTHMDATHIALWSPPVALAVADWLDRESDRGEHAYAPALTVANVILGLVPVDAAQ
jgi:hypothetical protein